MKCLLLGLLCSTVLVSSARREQPRKAESPDVYSLDLMRQRQVSHPDIPPRKTGEDLSSGSSQELKRSEKILCGLIGACGLSALISTVMYINDWGSMRAQVGKSHLGHAGFKLLAAPLILASLFVLYKRVISPGKKTEAL